jgi:hypothetical protein
MVGMAKSDHGDTIKQKAQGIVALGLAIYGEARQIKSLFGICNGPEAKFPEKKGVNGEEKNPGS